MIRCQREIRLAELDRRPRLFRPFDAEFAQHVSDQNLGLHQRETIADAFPGTEAERHIRVRDDVALVRVVETFRVEFLRLGEILWIVMKAVNGEPNDIVRVHD